VASEEVAVDEWELKAHARARRARRLEAERNGMDLHTRVVPASTQYRRGFKHPPRHPMDWESLD
jgi:hypothetical protein